MPESTLAPERALNRPRLGRRGMARDRPAEPCRPFTLLDAMILTGAIAAGLSLSRLLEPGLKPLDLIKNLRLLARFGTPILGSLGLAWLALRFRGPRPRFRRLMRQPGMVACVAATAILAIRWGHSPFLMLLTGKWQVLLSSELYLPSYFFVGPAVLGAWLSLYSGGRRRPERGWIDATGRAIGIAWIALFVLLMGHSIQNEWNILHPRSPRPRRMPSKQVIIPVDPVGAMSFLIPTHPKGPGTES